MTPLLVRSSEFLLVIITRLSSGMLFARFQVSLLCSSRQRHLAPLIQVTSESIYFVSQVSWAGKDVLKNRHRVCSCLSAQVSISSPPPHHHHTPQIPLLHSWTLLVPLPIHPLLGHVTCLTVRSMEAGVHFHLSVCVRAGKLEDEGRDGRDSGVSGTVSKRPASRQTLNHLA